MKTALVEQDHRKVKRRIYPMLGFKSFVNAATTISGVELVHKIRKGQFEITRMRGSAEAGAAQVWEALLAA